MKVQDRIGISLSYDPMDTRYVYEEEAQKEIADRDHDWKIICDRADVLIEGLKAKIEAANKAFSAISLDVELIGNIATPSDLKMLREDVEKLRAILIPRKEEAEK
jgi:hypothetical protein